MLPDSGTGHLVKRAVGMPGDHVRLNEQALIEVNGAALDEADYLYARDGVQVAPATVPFDIVVPQGHIFVMGTTATTPRTRCRLANGDGSIALVPVDKVVGAAVAIVSPLERLSTFSVPDSFDDVPDADAPPPERAELIHVEPGC
ncbi:S26 family signal peptidase [Tessaracoccus flavescens]|uniref:S26 family signal peptidase n=1 Tax=Tessaracoccus flavescens TaxID=399497 RepID=UPI0013966B39|nr:S26 family signal peptidase [Tessaracoccus flavescens]